MRSKAEVAHPSPMMAAIDPLRNLWTSKKVVKILLILTWWFAMCMKFAC